MAKYRRSRSSGARRPTRGYGRSYSGRYGRPAARRSLSRASARRPQRVEVVLRHVMAAAGGDPGYMPGVPGLVGVANAPKPKKGRTF